MKTGKTARNADTTRAFALLAIALAKGAAAHKAPATAIEFNHLPTHKRG